MNPKNKEIWRNGLTEEEKKEAEKKLREWIRRYIYKKEMIKS